jgi:hypothetical protein
MVNIRRTKSTVLTAGATLAGLLALVWVAIAFWAMWTMLGAAFDSDWLQAALMLMLWTTAVGTAYLCLAPPHGRLSRLGQDQRQPVNFDGDVSRAGLTVTGCKKGQSTRAAAIRGGRGYRRRSFGGSMKAAI